MSHSSAEHSRLYGFDPAQGVPPLDDFFDRIHPQDRARCTEALERATREATKIELEFRVLLPRARFDTIAPWLTPSSMRRASSTSSSGPPST